MTQLIEYSNQTQQLQSLRDFIPAAQQPAKVYLSGLAESGRVTQRDALDKVAKILTDNACDHETLDWSQLRFSHVAALRAHLQEAGYNFQYVNKILSAVRGVMVAAWQMELIDERDLARIKAVKGVKGVALLVGRSVPQNELRAIGAACNDGTVLGFRDAAMIALAVGAGLRGSEIIGLDADDYDRREGSLKIRSGKGNKDRIAFIADDNAAHVDKWLEYRPDVPGALLLPMRKGGVIELRRLSRVGAWKQLVYRARQAGVSGVTLHDLRRTFATEALEQGAMIVAVQHQLGHSSSSQTARYDRSGLRSQRKMVNSLNLGIGGFCESSTRSD